MPNALPFTLIACLIVSTPAVWARGGGGGPGGGAGMGPGVGGGHGNGISSEAAHAAPSAIVHGNGPLSLDRDHGIERAEDRMSAEGRENTNGPMSPTRSKGKARASQRHAEHKALDESERK